MSTHTPAPWVVAFRNDSSAYISMGDPTRGPHKQFDIELDARDPSDVADACLFSAAPDLLQALEEIINTEWLGGKGGFYRARAAIAKARGQQ